MHTCFMKSDNVNSIVKLGAMLKSIEGIINKAYEESTYVEMVIARNLKKHKLMKDE